MAYVYKHIRKDTNEVFYIGIGSDKSRINSKRDRNIHWKRIVEKYGYISQIIEDELTWEQACEIEIKLIKQYGRCDLKEGTLVNMTNGGDGGYGMRHSIETKLKISENSKNVSIEARKKMGDSNRGKMLSIETKQKIGDSNRGKKRSNDVIRILSESHKGHIHSESHKQKISESLKGRKLSEETKQKIKESKKTKK